MDDHDETHTEKEKAQAQAEEHGRKRRLEGMHEGCGSRRKKSRRKKSRRKKRRSEQDSKGHERQAKKRRSENLGKEGTGTGELLWLEVQAERVSGERRNVSEYCRVGVEKGNLVEGSVRGHPCTVCLDSGAASSVVMMSLAERMGLVTGGERRETTWFNTYLGKVRLDVITLAEVVLTLKGGVEVNTPVKVFPKEVEDRYPVHTLILSMNRLHEAEIVQEFHPDGSGSLFLRHPDRLRRRAPSGPGKVYTFGLRTLESDEPLTVMADTGSPAVLIVSKTGQDNVTRLTGKCMEPPPPVFLHFGHGKGVELDVVSKPLHKTDDFKCGRGLFYALSAVMDYADSSITVRLGREHYSYYKFAFYPRRTGVRAAHLLLDPLPSSHTVPRQ